MGYYELYQQALAEIDAQGVEWTDPAYYGLARQRHRELVELHKPDDMPICVEGVTVDLRYEDRETRIASGEPQWQAGEV